MLQKTKKTSGALAMAGGVRDGDRSHSRLGGDERGAETVVEEWMSEGAILRKYVR
jgi:hypothetical protein